MKQLVMVLGLGLVIAACSVAAGPERVGSARQAAFVCDNPPGDYVIAPASDTTPAYRVRNLQARLMGYPKKGSCIGSGLCYVAPTCDSLISCFVGNCQGWSCGWFGTYTSPDDGRVGARCDMRTEFLTELANPYNSLLTFDEKAELTTLRLGCQPFTNFECYEEI